MPKAIIELADWQRTRDEIMALGHQLDAGEDLPEADYHLGFSDAAQLFGDLTPARLMLLETLKALGPVSIATLARALARDDRGLHNQGLQTDIDTLLELALIEKNAAGEVLVPWEEIQIRVTLGRAKAA